MFYSSYLWLILEFVRWYETCKCDKCAKKIKKPGRGQILFLSTVSICVVSHARNWHYIGWSDPAGSWETLPPILLSLCRLQTEPGGSAFRCRLTPQDLLCQRLPQVGVLCSNNSPFQEQRGKPCQTGWTGENSHLCWLHVLTSVNFHWNFFTVSGSRLPTVLPAGCRYSQQKWVSQKLCKIFDNSIHSKWFHKEALWVLCYLFFFQGSTESIRVTSCDRNYHVECYRPGVNLI